VTYLVRRSLSVLPKINATRHNFRRYLLGAKTGIGDGNNAHCPTGTSSGHPILAYYVHTKL
jgi:hypothetical protein